MTKSHKIITIKKASQICNNMRKRGKIIGFATGIFDILHMGHVLFLKSIKKKVDILIIGVDDNKTAHLIKGEDQPFFDETERAFLLSCLTFVDYVFIFKGPCNSEVLQMVNPNYYCLSPFDPSMKNKRKDAKEAGVKILLSPSYLKSHSSSKIGRTLRFSYLMSKSNNVQNSWEEIRKN